MTSSPEVSSSAKKERDIENHWITVDKSEDTMHLLDVSGQTFDQAEPASVRRTIDEKSRFLLLEKLKLALTSAVPSDEQVPFGGVTYHVTVKPILSPDKRVSVGAYGIYTALGKERPEEPVIGTWQWRVSKTDGTNIGEDASLWDETLTREIYQLPDKVFTSSRGPAGDWLNKLIAPKDRPAIKFMIDNGIDVNNSKRHLLTYEITRGYGSSNPTKAQISNSARAYPDPDYPEAVMLRGFSRIVPSPTAIQLPGLKPSETNDILQSVFELLEGEVFFGIDQAQDITFFRSPSWDRQGLPADFEHSITALTHPDDLAPTEKYLNAIHNGTPAEPLTVKIKTVKGDYQTFSLAAVPITTEAETRYLIARLSPQGKEG